MLRVARKMCDRAASSAAAVPPLQSLIAVGLRQEFQPHWPVPLPAALPAHKNRHTLVLDIDETLIHTYGMAQHVSQPDEPPAMQQVGLVDYHMLLRPHLKAFLTEVNELFELVFWTAGTASYCSAVLGALETQVMDLPPSFMHYLEMCKSANGEESTSHANFYALSRTQTLERQSYMKYLPMLGRPLKQTIMLDDNVRSFPLTPRNGIRIPEFLPNDRVIIEYMNAGRKAEGKPFEELDEATKMSIYNGTQEVERLQADRALLDVLPLLRQLAAVPVDQDITRELDHWRDVDYVKCDDFGDTMKPTSVARNTVLGVVLPKRRAEPIPPLRIHPRNIPFTESARAEMEYFTKRIKPRTGSRL